jgi:hypothetical protein
MTQDDSKTLDLVRDDGEVLLKAPAPFSRATHSMNPLNHPATSGVGA